MRVSKNAESFLKDFEVIHGKEDGFLKNNLGIVFEEEFRKRGLKLDNYILLSVSINLPEKASKLMENKDYSFGYWLHFKNKSKEEGHYIHTNFNGFFGIEISNLAMDYLMKLLPVMQIDINDFNKLIIDRLGYSQSDFTVVGIKTQNEEGDFEIENELIFSLLRKNTDKVSDFAISVFGGTEESSFIPLKEILLNFGEIES